MVEAMSHKGYRCALGSVYPYDATIPSSKFAGRFVLRNVRPGAVIVLHDGGARGRRTVRTLRTVLPELRRRGYRVVTLGQALAATSLPSHRESAGGGPRPTSTILPQRGSW
jgi:peptidoglycan/xylan/chitin deacetylase (PgdA/CDA1 family)